MVVELLLLAVVGVAVVVPVLRSGRVWLPASGRRYWTATSRYGVLRKF